MISVKLAGSGTALSEAPLPLAVTFNQPLPPSKPLL